MSPTAVIALDAGGLEFHVTTLPGQDIRHGRESLVHVTETLEDGLATSAVQLLEETEYTYSFAGVAGPLAVEPVELFNPSDATGRSGRLRTGRSTGTISAIARDAAGTLLGRLHFEVRSRKLNYLSEYRWMLQRIADEAAEAAQSHFAPSELGAFRPDDAGEAETLYQRFAFLKALLDSRAFTSSLQLVVTQPHREFVESVVGSDPRLGLRSSSRIAREMARPGPRVSVSGLPFISSIPTAMRRTEHVETFDTVPNRFVKHALSAWRTTAYEVADACSRRNGPAASRGQVEAIELAERLESYLRAPVFLDVGTLTVFPAQNTVLQGRPGYRDVLRAYLQADAAAKVDWAGSRDAFGAGQRDVATLYEYWVFLELGRIVSRCPGFSIDRRPLFKRSGDQLSLELRRGQPALVRGVGTRRGRRVEIELWFNRHFGANESWTEPMRPDCSLRISTTTRDETKTFKWLHFDAKYRVNSYREVFNQTEGEPIAGDGLRPVSADLLKMHAYRDALRRTSGAYVLYPGGDEDSTRHAEFHELLPGLGAFVLRPVEEGVADPVAAHTLQSFINEAIDHLTADGTDEQRSAFWKDLVYREQRGRRLSGSDLTDVPPADVSVLLGFVRSVEHQTWIESTSLYNLRADERVGSVGLTSPEPACDLVWLYDADGNETWLYRATGAFILQTDADLRASGYPHQPGSSLYCCLVLGERLPPPMIPADGLRDLARRGRDRASFGAPFACALDEILGLL